MVADMHGIGNKKTKGITEPKALTFTIKVVRKSTERAKNGYGGIAS